MSKKKKQKHTHVSYSRFPSGYMPWRTFWKNARRTAKMANGEAPSTARAAKYQQFLQLQRLDGALPHPSDIHRSVDKTLALLLETALRAAQGNGFRIDSPWVFEALVAASDMLDTRDDTASAGAIWHAREVALIEMARAAVTSEAGETLLDAIDPSHWTHRHLAGDVVSAERHADTAPADFDVLYRLLRTFDQDDDEDFNRSACCLLGDVIDMTALGRQERRQRARAAFDAVGRATEAFVEALARAKGIDARAKQTLSAPRDGDHPR
jgi:hypothetical protein